MSKPTGTEIGLAAETESEKPVTADEHPVCKAVDAVRAAVSDAEDYWKRGEKSVGLALLGSARRNLATLRQLMEASK